MIDHIIKGVREKFRGNTIVRRFLQGIWLHTQRIDGANGLPKETYTTIMMLYENAKAMVLSPDGDANFFNIVAGVL